MTLKNAAAGLPHGGGKVVVFADPKMPRPDKERLIRALACALGEVPEYIMAPDMGTDEECMAWIRDENQAGWRGCPPDSAVSPWMKWAPRPGGSDMPRRWPYRIAASATSVWKRRGWRSRALARGRACRPFSGRTESRPGGRLRHPGSGI